MLFFMTISVHKPQFKESWGNAVVVVRIVVVHVASIAAIAVHIEDIVGVTGVRRKPI